MQTVSPLQRTQMDSGRARQRRRFTNTPTVVSVSWLMNGGQAALFESWFQHSTMDGAAWFECPLDTPGKGLKHYNARFADIYDGPELVGVDHWRYTADVELRDRPVLGEGWPEVPGFVAYLDIFDLAMNREWPER